MKSGAQLELANPDLYESPRDYVEKHLAPVATELHRLLNEFLAPGSTSVEEAAVDMTAVLDVPHSWSNVDRVLKPLPKSVSFNGRDYFLIPKETLRAKQLKVQLTAVAYVKDGGAAELRIVRGDDGTPIPASVFRVIGSEPRSYVVNLPFGEAVGCVTPQLSLYVMQARRLQKQSIPVCRRFSMQFLLI